MKITFKGTDGERTLEIEDQNHLDDWLEKKLMRQSFVDENRVERDRFSKLEDGGTYTLGPPVKQQSSEGKPLGEKAEGGNKRQKKEVPMEKDTLIQHIKGCQEASGIAARAAQIHSDEDKAIHLQSRQYTLQKFTEAIKERRENLSENSQDRTKYPMPVFSGMKGLGKTRMLEEWPSAFNLAGISDSAQAVIVTYGNGTGVSDQDKTLPIGASFGWRLLHQLFVKKNSKDGQLSKWTSPGFLPANAAEMTLLLALEVIQGLLQEFGIVTSGNMCCLFIGVDEYQSIPKGSVYENKRQQILSAPTSMEVDISQELKNIRKDSYLWKLIEEFDQCRDSITNLQIYPAFAGTKFGDLSIAGSCYQMVDLLPMEVVQGNGGVPLQCAQHRIAYLVHV